MIKSSLMTLSKLKSTKKLYLFVLFVFFIAVSFLIYPQGPVVSRIVVISPGMTAKEVANLLKNNDLIKNELFFLFLVRLRDVQNKLQAGEYSFSNNMNSNSILSKIIKGEVENTKLTIPEGYTAKQIANLIEERKLGSKEKFIKETEERKLEGYLFPNTYLIYSGMDEKQIIDMMYKEFNRVFKKFTNRLDEVGLTEREVIILASIIEKEAKEDKERSLISSVFHNRLKKGWLLESCATVQYALGDHKAKLTYEDLKVKSPYNTYIYPGLPPGPISNPGEASIRAALYPQVSDVLFFVTEGDGTHKFSKYYKEHLKKKEEKKFTQ